MATKTVELARLGDIVVERKYDMTYEEFSEKHLFGNYPVVIGDACNDWSTKKKLLRNTLKQSTGTQDDCTGQQLYAK
ncbi:hypothetical protein [Spirosoma utsteinense]|uniref:Uncharacterized protein n=1 Tax=Spirosoma utsteinense TaxID=2585773 RepID=A0ABR6WEY3_9BACT|nr:hypothetical protein [Spirosoma utsteinense]MBC3788533.1 hypothetical protein [Spirosoma utsteinense]MBC3794576.1 hypothetical protein [Spirosoma utsteinense]